MALPLSRKSDALRKEEAWKSILQRLALKGSCVKDGGEAHAMLLVPMRMEQQQLLPREVPHEVFTAVRRLTLLPPSPRDVPMLDERMLRFQADRHLALLAVRRRGLALQRLPLELREDKEVVLTAVRGKARALEFAAPRLRRDVDVAIEALQAPQGHKAIAFLDEGLLKHERISTLVRGRKESQQAIVQRELERDPVRFSPEILCLLHL